jgi:hypothetical protein
MRLNKLSGRKKVTIDQLIAASDKNQTSSTVVELLDDVRKEMRNFDKILVIVEGKKGVARWEYGFSSNEIVYLCEHIKHQTLFDGMIDDFLNDYGEEEDDNGTDI